MSLRGSEAPEAIYYHSDHLGSSSIITDSTGAQVQHLEYTPYGTIAINEGTDVVKHKFTGKELDNTGLYFYSARYYDPEIGRFITADTIVQAPYDPQSLNRYSYCRNNPINYVDPNGHFFWFIAAIIIGAIMGGVSAATSGGSIGMGILMGALGGALVAGGAAGAYALWGPAWAFVGAAAGGAASGAANAAVSGGNIGIGALTGAIGAGVGCGVGYGVGQAAGAFWGTLAGAASGAAASTGVDAGLSGSDFGSNIGMNLAFSTAGALAGYGTAKAFASKTNQTSQQKAPKQLETDQKPTFSSNAKISTDGPYVGEEIFRVFDGVEAKWDGKSWTPVNPNSVPNYRVQAGLPNANSGRFVAQARITDTGNIIVREATVIYGNGDVKMIKEYRFKNPPKAQIKLERVSGVNPEY